MKIKSRFLMDLIYDILGSALYSTGIYTFAGEAGFAPGGLSGLSLIVNHLFGIPVGIMIFLLNVPVIFICLKTLGRDFVLRSLRTMLFTISFMDILFPMFPVYTGSRFLAALYSGICIGSGLAFFYMRGSSSGGTDFLIMTIKKRRPHFSIGRLMMIFDFVIILLGWPVFRDIDAVLYGLVSVFTGSAVIDKIMYSRGSGKLLIIITDNGADVAMHIGKVCRRGSTLINAKGTYTSKNRQVLLCACSRAQAFLVRNAVYNADKDAFVMITETNEVFGEGFSPVA